MRRAILLVLTLALGGCNGIQSALAPRGSNADHIATLGWVLFIGAALIFMLVMALAVYALRAAPERRRRFGNNAFIIGGGIVFPVVTLTALLIYGLSVSARIGDPPAAEPLRIEVIGEQWWWRVRYLGEDQRPDIITANEIRIPVGRPIEFILKSADVIHSFWVPNLGGKLDMIPGKVTRLRLQADQAGVFRGQCAEYCGGAHALMAFFVVARPPEEFEAWLARQELPAPAPETPFLEHGRRMFLEAGCGACHTIRGTPANGTIGPDLTHVGGRLSLAAGILPNNAGTFAGWIADSRRIKPENHMPSFNIFDGESLRALAAYLESLQ